MNSTVRFVAGLIGIVSLIGLAGCSGGGPTLAKVSGKVTFEGKPVTGGAVTFAPIAERTGGAVAGRPATGEVKSDGTFALGTNKPGDGAILGKHRITYFPPAPAAAPAASGEPGKHDETPTATSPYKALKPKQAEAEVKAGTNEIVIELVPDPNAASILSREN